MQTKRVRQRITPTYLQTFHFTDPPQPVHPALHHHCPSCNPISHPLTRQETNQQKQHKNKLKNIKEPTRYVNVVSNQISFERKQDELRGQLQDTGIGFFLRERQRVGGNCGDRLIASDCGFDHTCYGGTSPMNEFCGPKFRNFDTDLRSKYDFKHHNRTEISPQSATYMFKQKSKPNPKHKNKPK